MVDIKPPTGAGPGAVDPSAVAEADTEGAEGTQANEGPAFSAYVDAARETAGSGAVGEPFAELSAQVRQGAISQAEAVDQLIEGALAGVEGTLSEAQRAELVETMRSALEHDPTLLALQAELGK